MSAYDITLSGLVRALAPQRMNVTPTVGDLIEWERSCPDRPCKHLSWALSVHVSCGTGDPVSLIKERLERRRWRCERARDNGHWSFDSNALVAVQQLLTLIERFEMEMAP